MSYAFPTDIRERLDAILGEGAYQNEDDVIRDAMDALERIEKEKLARWNERNRLSIAQREAGLAQPLNEEKILERVRARLIKEGIL